jgi:DNA-binding GntR family transcriptional regulator
VKTLSYIELHDLTSARTQIEVAVLIDSIRNGDLQWESEVIAAHHILDQTPIFDPEDPSRMSDSWAAVHERFHAALLSRSSNQRMSAFAARLREEAELYRRWSVSLSKPENRDVPSEHRKLVELATSRRAEEAGKALAAHIARTTELVLAIAEDEPLPALVREG